MARGTFLGTGGYPSGGREAEKGTLLVKGDRFSQVWPRRTTSMGETSDYQERRPGNRDRVI